MDDVVGHVGFGAGDEAFDAGDIPGAVVVLDGLGAAVAPTSEPASGSVSTIVQCQPFSTIRPASFFWSGSAEV